MKRDPSLVWHRPDPTDIAELKVAVVGGTDGIGRALARVLVAKGAEVVVVGRTFRDQGTKGLTFLKADLSEMAEAKRVADELPAGTLDVIVFTTGVMAGPGREVTRDGIEQDLAISYLSRLVILRGIVLRLGSERPNGRRKPRVFVMGFPGSGQKADVEDLNSERSYGRMRAHMNTVAGNEALVLDAAERCPNLDIFGLNPGFVKTGIRSQLFGGKKWLYHLIERLTDFMTKDPNAYAATIAPLLIAPELGGRSGAMFDAKARAILPSTWLDRDATRRVIEASEALLQRTSLREQELPNDH